MNASTCQFRRRGPWHSSEAVELSFLGVAAILEWRGPDLDALRLPLVIAGPIAILLAGAAIGMVVAAKLALRRHRQSSSPARAPTALVTSGIFARTRNPIYVASIILLAAVALVWTPWLLVLLPLAPAVFYLHLIRYEERLLASSFPDTYPLYASRVPRWWGRTTRGRAHWGVG